MHRRPSASTGFLGDCRVTVFGEIADRHVGPLARKQHGNRSADAGIAAGNQGDFAGKFIRADIIGSVIERSRFNFRFLARFGQMLLGEGWLRIYPSAGLHGVAPLAGGSLPLILFVGFALDLALLQYGIVS